MPQPTPDMLGSGMVQQAGLALQLRNAYNKAAMEAQANGMQIAPFEQWIKEQQPAQPQSLAAMLMGR